eukprot:gene1601-1749_t
MFTSRIVRAPRVAGRCMSTAKRSFEKTSLETWTGDSGAYPIMCIASGAGLMAGYCMYKACKKDPDVKILPDYRKTALRGEDSFKFDN